MAKKKRRIRRTAVSAAVLKRAQAIANRLKRAPRAPRLQKTDVDSLLRPESGAGGGRSIPRSRFTLAEPKQTVHDEVPRMKIPKWVKAMIERGASRKDVFTRAHELLRVAPTTANHVLVQVLINEFGRPARGRLNVRKSVTQARVSPFIKED